VIRTFKGIGVWLLLCVSLIMGWGVAWAWSAEEVIEGIQRRYQEIKDLQADFRQETTLPMMDRVNEATGRLYLKIPGKMRWDYFGKQKKTFVINDQTMWFYEPLERQVTITDLSRLPNSHELLSFLTGMGDLKRDFLLEGSGPLQETREGFLVVQLRPKTQGSQWTHLRLVVDPKTFQVVQSAFEGVQGERTVIDYDNIRTHQGLPDELFTFQIPEGVEVLHYPPRDEK